LIVGNPTFGGSLGYRSTSGEGSTGVQWNYLTRGGHAPVTQRRGFSADSEWNIPKNQDFCRAHAEAGAV